MWKVRNVRFLLTTFGFLFAATAALADDTAAQALSILKQQCVQCHSDQLVMSGLKMTTRDLLLKGGTRGPAMVPGDASASLLITAVAQTGKLLMPPVGKLADDQIAILRGWVDAGAPWPDTTTAVAAPEWWAFQKPARPPVPRSGSLNPIDAFIDAGLTSAGLEPAPEADRHTLLKRASYDLLGLPPTPEQVAAFETDAAPGAWERLIDSLLQSPRYGEKWGQHWLDLVRYADTSGFEQDPYVLEGWRYRDYVIDSFNKDKPYDVFAKEQLAADELFPSDPEARTGTGYYRVGTNRDMLFKVEDLNRVEKLTDYVDTTSQVFLGLTVGCARCHDHKFDPIPQSDFYRMQAIFAPAVNDRVFLEYNDARFYDIAANSREFRLRQIGQQLADMLNPVRDRLRKERIAKLPEEVRAIFELPTEKRTPEQQAIFAGHQAELRVRDEDVRAALPENDRETLTSIENALVGIFNGYKAPPMSPGVIDIGREAPRTYIAERGNWENPGVEVGPGFLTCLGGGDVPEPPEHATTTGRRKALAEWIASPDNSLFSRVMVNRIWQYHFGSGLIKTPSDFGTRAGSPTHPELLDWLAVEFGARGFSIKQMHRLIMTSEAYKLTSVPTPSAREKDPENNLLSHFERRQLSAEEIRDAILQVSGALNLKMGGEPAVPPLESEELHGIIGRPDSAWRVTPDRAEHHRRGIYLLHRRTFQQPMMAAFDAPDGVLTCARRNESATAPQALALLNSRFMVNQSDAAVAHLESPSDAFLRVLGRSPSAIELSAADEFVARQTERLGTRRAAMAELARGFMNLNEFLYVD